MHMRLAKRGRVVLVLALGVIGVTDWGLADRSASPLRVTLYDPFALRSDHSMGQMHQPHHSATDHGTGTPDQ
jgi:hypothetical protein